MLKLSSAHIPKPKNIREVTIAEDQPDKYPNTIAQRNARDLDTSVFFHRHTKGILYMRYLADLGNFYRKEMKYYTLGTSNAAAETRTSGFTSYADIGVSENKMTYTEKDVKKIREELENVQKDLKLQTKRCRHLVDEYTRKLQEKERMYRSEKVLRDTQLAKVLKALLIFEARLRQEQKLISHQLNEKDFIITTQKNDIKKLLASNYCKNCNQYYTSPSTTLESLDSNSEYVPTEHDYQSSNLESLDSSSEICGASSEREYPKSESDHYEKNDSILQSKNNYNLHTTKKPTTKQYFEVLKIRNESPSSNEDNTSADYDNLDSLPPESISDKISVVSSNIEDILNKTRNLGSANSDSSVNISSSECNKTVITAIAVKNASDGENKLTETIPVFESSGDTNDNWYASASDQEDEEHGNIYRNNPVLECMNQILLQNINDINSPPKTPSIERKSNKSNKRVKFSDEENKIEPEGNKSNYYETPIQQIPNFYETPQSIYSNDYEQILSKNGEACDYPIKPMVTSRKISETKENHHYIEMEKTENTEKSATRKNKILRIPPALPPKPANLVSKCKITNLPKKAPSELSSSYDLEPDYCSISELNLPQNKLSPANKISVVAEVHNPTSLEIKNRINIPSPNEKVMKKSHDLKEEIPSLIVKKCVDKLNIELAKQTSLKHESNLNNSSFTKKHDVQIPKLPQVSEIIIPDDPEENKEALVSQDNYVRNNTQILQDKCNTLQPIKVGSSVSSIISGFNNNKIINEIKKKHEKLKLEPKKGFSSFENLQNLDKHFIKSPIEPAQPEIVRYEHNNFDLSQNFEEFKLDDCEIEEYDVGEELELEDKLKKQVKESCERNENPMIPSLNRNSIEQLKIQLESQRTKTVSVANKEIQKVLNQPTYEHFLECTGLSSKSILTPSRTLSNHKHMLKPKDVKLRSKVRASANIFEKLGGSRVKYWSEPFV
ncbi:hypothetical protein ABEB36_005192 [Hypothenemus hampei]|uniref:Uncharacterized protein n=1 Tax=Hypothenemus hampei TaxID=57062 RepID=A0ABD1EXB9_HYPHA